MSAAPGYKVAGGACGLLLDLWRRLMLWTLEDAHQKQVHVNLSKFLVATGRRDQPWNIPGTTESATGSLEETVGKRRNQKKNVFCLETASWEPGIRDKSSVEPVLRLLEMSKYRVSHVHFDVATREEFEFLLRKWAGASFRDTHPILYLGFHGAPGKIWIGEKRDNGVSMDGIAEILDGRCKGRVLYFGSCDTLDDHGNRLNAFLRKTGALAVCGYRTDVNWLQAAAFEMLALGSLQDAFFTRPGMRKFGRELWETAPGLARTLGFRLTVSP